MSVINHYVNTLKDVADACQKYGRDMSEVLVLAVSKGQNLSDMQTLYQHGQRDFAENYLQEAMIKINDWPASDIIWHYIGKIQTNKCKKIASLFDWVHTISRKEELMLLNEHRAQHTSPLNICIQVNLARESQKGGVDVDALFSLVEDALQYRKIALRGLMLMPPAGLTKELQYHLFHELFLLKEKINSQFQLALDTLSMGMSDDYQEAIRAHATIIRLGRILFGGRD